MSVATERTAVLRLMVLISSESFVRFSRRRAAITMPDAEARAQTLEAAWKLSVDEGGLRRGKEVARKIEL